MDNSKNKEIPVDKEKHLIELVEQYLKEYDRFIEKVAYSTQRKCPRLEIEDIKQQLSMALFVNMRHFDL